MEIRNIAIIAHVDHGKTALTDAILKQTGMTEGEVSMDSNDLERERGITIYSKNTSVFYKGTKINILDTPGHADFGSEVERVLRSVDSVLLVVDAAEGPMPQTKFVLKKSLELGLKPILVLNKIDKPTANVKTAAEAVCELFLDLGATDDQFNFETIYAIGRDGVAKKNMDDEATDLTPILDAILEQVPPASGDNLAAKPLKMQVFNLAYDNFLGRMGICRIYEGTVKANQKLFVKDVDGSVFTGKVSKLYTFEGMAKKEVAEASAGDIVMLAGFPDIYIGQTLIDDETTEQMPAIAIDEPILSLYMFVNTSPFAGQSGKFLTSRKIKERLEKELQVNVGLKVDFMDAKFKVSGRGELHLAVLIENMRREGYELAVSQPEVIFKYADGDSPMESDTRPHAESSDRASIGAPKGEKLEPFEEVSVLVPEEFSGVVIEKLGKRKGTMTNMGLEHGEMRMMFDVPTRGLLGYRNEFVVDTKGKGILTSMFLDFRPYVGDIVKTEFGSMTSMVTGKALGYALNNLQERGMLYIKPGTEVYEGMVIGNTAKGADMPVNPIKGKQLTNTRASGTDEAIRCTPPMELTLEKAIGLMREDEFLEVTPTDIRLRKQYLTENDRKKHLRAQ